VEINNIGQIALPDGAVRCKKLRDTVVNAGLMGGDVVADKTLLYGLLGIVAEIEASISHAD